MRSDFSMFAPLKTEPVQLELLRLQPEISESSKFDMLRFEPLRFAPYKNRFFKIDSDQVKDSQVQSGEIVSRNIACLIRQFDHLMSAQFLQLLTTLLYGAGGGS